MLWFGQGWLVLLVDVSLKSLVLAAVAALTLAIFKVRNANVQHRTWTAVLLGMLTLPLLVPLTPTVPIPAWLLPEFPVSRVSTQQNSAETLSQRAARPLPPVAEFPTTDADDFLLGNATGGEEPARRKSGFADPTQRDGSGDATAPIVPLVETGDHAVESASPVFGNKAWFAWLARHWPATIWVAYLVITLWFIMRIAIGVWGSTRIVARAQVLDTPPQFSTKATVLESDDLRVPLTVGFARPKILLPTSWRNWSPSKLEAVFAHECEHIRRGDYVITVLAELNRALHWFHPLAWLLRRWLSDLAEQNCDDAVIASTGERTQYARHLLEVASSMNEQPGRLVWSGIAMARKANVETRIDAILDAKRPLAQQLGIVGGMLLVAAAVPAVLLAAAIRPGDPLTSPENESAVSVATVPAETEVAAAETESTKPADSENAGANDTLQPPKAVTGKVAEESTAPQIETVPVDIKPAAVEDDGDEWRSLEPNASVTQAPAETLTTPQRVYGQVLGPDGKGTAATVYVVSKYIRGFMQPVRERQWGHAQTDANGRFDFELRMPALDPSISRGSNARVEQIVAKSDGYGPAISDAIGLRAGDELQLRLVSDDVPIEGQILDLEGHPVANATLAVALLVPVKDLDQHLTSLREQAKANPNPMSASFSFMAAEDFLNPVVDSSSNERVIASQLHYPCLTPPSVKTDAQGRFRLTGIGRDRLAALELSGPNIVTSRISVVTRDIAPIKASMFVGGRTNTTYGRKFIYSAEPSQVIQGVVTDANTGEPIEGAMMESEHYDAGYTVSTTGADGRYHLDGLPKAKQHRLRIHPPADKPYFSRDIGVTDFATGLQPTKVDVKLKPAVWITGRVTDKLTGEPVAARVAFLPHVENKNAEEYPSLRKGTLNRYGEKKGATTDAQGKFRLAVIPGEGILAVLGADPSYCVGVGSETLTPRWLGFERNMMTNTYDTVLPQWVNSLTIVDVPPGGDASFALSIDPGQSLSLRLRDPDGNPLLGVRVKGRLPQDMGSIEPPLTTDEVVIRGIDPQQPRAVFLYHPERNLAKFLMPLKGNLKTSELRLAACGTLRGRVVNEDGTPSPNQTVFIRPDALTDSGTSLPIAKTDEDGRFETTRFFPGAKFKLIVRGEQIFDVAELKPGETRDIGDLRLDTPRQLGQNQAPDQRLNIVAAQGDKVDVIEGSLVVDGGNQPPGDLKIYKGRFHSGEEKEEFARIPNSVIAKDGTFAIEMTNLLTEQTAEIPMDHWVESGIFATAKGYGLAWLDEIKGAQAAERHRLHLVRDDIPIQGRVVDAEGHPVEGANVSVRYIYANREADLTSLLESLRSATGSLNEHIAQALPLHRNLFNGDQAASPIGIVGQKTNHKGEFTIHGIGRERLAMVYIEGTGVQQQKFNVVTRDMVPITRNMQGAQSPEIIYGAKSTFVVAMGLTIEGVVRDSKTRSTLAGVLIRDSMLNNASGAMKPNFATKTDEQGRYRITGFPTTGENRLMAVPNDEQPYLVHDRPIRPPSAPGATTLSLDFELYRGIWIRGRVIEKESKKPVWAELRHFPFLDNDHARELPDLDGAGTNMASSRLQHRYRTRADGSFRLVGIPGHAIVGVDAMGPYLNGVGADRIQGINDQGQFNTYENGGKASQSLNALVEINPTADQQEVTVNFEVERGQERQIHLVDEKGKPVMGTHVSGNFPTAVVFPQQHWLPTVNVNSLGPDEKRRVLVQHHAKNLAAIAEVSPENPQEPAMIELRPAASIRGRLRLPNGDPIEGATVEAQTILIRNAVRIGKAVTDEQGDFLIEAMPGPIEVELRLPGDGRIPEEAQKHTIEPGKVLDLGTLVVK